MGAPLWGRRWVRFRVVIYVLVIVGLLVWRDRARLADWFERVFVHTTSSQVAVGGLDLGRPCLDSLLDRYQRENPALTVLRLGGGTVDALEGLLRSQIDVGVICRQPTVSEQAQFEDATGDTLSFHRFALGALRLLGGASLAAEAVSSGEIRDLLAGQSTDHFDRLFTVDPNLGLWNVLHERLGLGLPKSARPANVYFLSDAATLRRRLAADPRALGIVGSLGDANDGSATEAVVLPWYDDESNAAFLPNDENVAAGSYPLYHELYVATRSDVSIDGARLVTHLVSDRGQRQVWRAGALPVRMAAREVFLSKRPLDTSHR